MGEEGSEDLGQGSREDRGGPGESGSSETDGSRLGVTESREVAGDLTKVRMHSHLHVTEGWKGECYERRGMERIKEELMTVKAELERVKVGIGKAR